MTTQTPTKTKPDARSGKYLTFFLNEERYAARIDEIEEVIAVGAVTPVPQVPPYILGVTNIRGRVVPVIDLRVKFRTAQLEDLSSEACVIVVHFQRDGRKFHLGCVCNSIGEVLQVDSRKIEASPSFGARVDTRYLRGVVRVDDEEIALLLDIRNAMTAVELEAAAEASQRAEQNRIEGSGSESDE